MQAYHGSIRRPSKQDSARQSSPRIPSFRRPETERSHNEYSAEDNSLDVNPYSVLFKSRLEKKQAAKSFVKFFKSRQSSTSRKPAEETRMEQVLTRSESKILNKLVPVLQ